VPGLVACTTTGQETEWIILSRGTHAGRIITVVHSDSLGKKDSTDTHMTIVIVEIIARMF